MPVTFRDRFSQASLTPYKWPEEVIREDFPMLANSVIALGQTVAQITAASQNDVQTVVLSSPVGSWSLTFGNTVQYTATFSGAASAATVQAGLEALPNIGSGNVTVSGTTTLTITFVGALANNYQTVMVLNTTALASGSITIAHTTTGRQLGAIVAYDGTTVADPATAPTLSAAGADGSLAVGSYIVTYTYVTAAGESLPSGAASIAVSSTNHITIASLTGLASSITSVNAYVNGVFAKNQAVTAGATGAINITALPTSGGHVAPTVSTAFTNSDGRQIPVGFAWYAMATDPAGNITEGSSVATGNEFGNVELTGNVAVGGCFLCASLSNLSGAGIDARTVATLGRLLSGTVASGVFMEYGI